ncbi:MAG: hypothetical protein WBS15_12935 [Mycobacterium sp.]
MLIYRWWSLIFLVVRDLAEDWSTDKGCFIGLKIRGDATAKETSYRPSALLSTHPIGGIA